MDIKEFNFDELSDKGKKAVYYFRTVKLESWIEKMFENPWIKIKEYILETEAPEFLNKESGKIFVVIAELHAVSEDTKESIKKLDSFEFVCDTMKEAERVGGELASYLYEIVRIIEG